MENSKRPVYVRFIHGWKLSHIMEHTFTNSLFLVLPKYFQFHMANFFTFCQNKICFKFGFKRLRLNMIFL